MLVFCLYFSGDRPCIRLKALVKTAGSLYPQEIAILSTEYSVVLSSSAALVRRKVIRYCWGDILTSLLNRVYRYPRFRFTYSAMSVTWIGEE